MVIDTSAIIAIVLNEPEATTFEQKIVDDPVRLMSAASVLETAIVVEARLGEQGARELDLWLRDARIDVCAIDNELIKFARQAWRSYGKGRHPASLNFGDCFSYALARMRRETLLFKGNDFSKTDVAAAA